jgi:hypothetical protein
MQDKPRDFKIPNANEPKRMAWKAKWKRKKGAFVGTLPFLKKPSDGLGLREKDFELFHAENNPRSDAEIG